MSHTVSEQAQQPRLVVDRYETMDMVSINFILPKGVLKTTRSREISEEILQYIDIKGIEYGTVTHYHPNHWQVTDAQR